MSYKRILLKLSGESLGGSKQTGISPEVLNHFASEIKSAVENNVQVGIVIGGGNIFRGLSENAKRMDRVTADQMGMLATIINSLALGDALKQAGLKVKVMTATAMLDYAELFTKRNAAKYLSEGQVVLIAGGTGNPFFTTDTAGVLRAVEIEADVILKGTRVDGVYDSDPEKNANAEKYTSLSYIDVINKGLKVMDSTAITLAMDNALPIIVFDFNTPGNLQRVISGDTVGTIVQE